MPDTLYDDDFYEWTKTQAALLRRREAGSNALDYDHLAEEIEDMGRSQLAACRSLVRSILLHLLKLELALDRQHERHWRAEVRAFRDQLEEELSPSLRASLPAELDRLYAKARRYFLDLFEPGELSALPPQDCPWTWDEVAGADGGPPSP
jgi:hypothetical protein